MLGCQRLGRRRRRPVGALLVARVVVGCPGWRRLDGSVNTVARRACAAVRGGERRRAPRHVRGGGLAHRRTPGGTLADLGRLMSGHWRSACRASLDARSARLVTRRRLRRRLLSSVVDERVHRNVERLAATRPLHGVGAPRLLRAGGLATR
eukprot:7391699-Prymnesium_polylepis.4